MTLTFNNINYRLRKIDRDNLFEHNYEAVKNILYALTTSNRTCVIHPTGTGKFYIISTMIQMFHKKKHLTLTPSIHIENQIKKQINNKNVSYYTYQMSISKNIDFNKFLNFDFIFIDEFHRIGSEIWGGWVSDLLELNPQAKIIGTSATHIRYLDDHKDMAEEIFNNNIASRMDLLEAFNKGILPKPIYCIISEMGI